MSKIHHYGVFKAEVSHGSFNIVLKNEIIGAKINISGPLEGLFDDRTIRFNNENVKRLASWIAGFFMRTLIPEPK